MIIIGVDDSVEDKPGNTPLSTMRMRYPSPPQAQTADKCWKRCSAGAVVTRIKQASKQYIRH